MLGPFRRWAGRRKHAVDRGSVPPIQKGSEGTVTVPYFQEPQPAQVRVPSGGTTVVDDGDSLVKILDWHESQHNLRLLSCQTAKAGQFDYALLSRDEARKAGEELLAFASSPEPSDTDTKVVTV